jgi:hypothetical protein
VGGNLLESNYGFGTVGEYNASTGATVNSSFISVANANLAGMAVSSGAAVPEPSTWTITALGIALLGFTLRKKRLGA